MDKRDGGPFADGEADEAEREIVFATFQPGRLRKWSRAEMRKLSAPDIQEMLESRRAVVLAEFQTADRAIFRP